MVPDVKVKSAFTTMVDAPLVRDTVWPEATAISKFAKLVRLEDVPVMV